MSGLSDKITKRLRGVIDTARVIGWPAPAKPSRRVRAKAGAAIGTDPVGDVSGAEILDAGIDRQPAAASQARTAPKPDLDPDLVDLFCRQFGEDHRSRLTPSTDMDDIDGWDSNSFLGFVLTLEEAYGVTFSDAEATQMFQLGHIQKILRHAKLDLPHDDVAHACCQLQRLIKAPSDVLKVVVLSGSSTREGFMSSSAGRDLLRKLSGQETAEWYNMSISGLVAAETLQLVETIKSIDNAVLLIGWSPIIYAGCGKAEFKRAATHQRFPFAAPKMDRILKRQGYVFPEEEKQPSIGIDVWVERYLKGRSLEALHYEPYLYPTLAPWTAEKYRDEEAIQRFYNHALANYEQSMGINDQIFRDIIGLAAKRGLTLGFLGLTLQSELCSYLETLGQIVSRTDAALASLRADTGIAFIDAVAEAGITDEDFRDPAHIMRKREAYTECAIGGALTLFAKRGT